MSAMKLPWLVLACAVAVAGCSGGNSGASGQQTGGKPSAGGAPEVQVTKTDVKEGKGPRSAEPGDTVWVQYRGTLKNGTQFDSNMEGDPYMVRLGEGGVIKGWEQGIPGMKVGGERKLVVPPELAYGENAREKIPANSTLLFDIKLLGLMKAGEEYVIDMETLKPGKGTRTVAPGDKVSINFTGALVNGRVVQDTKGKPYTFTVGESEVLSAIDKGVQGMKVGEVRKIIAPPMTAYASIHSAAVPANSMIHFTVTLVSIK